jgi:hypothetical protein
MKRIIIMYLVFSLFALLGDLGAQNKKRGEISLGGGIFFADGGSSAFGAVSLGFYEPFIGVELNGAILEGGALIGGNLSVGPFAALRFIPYATGGIWTTTFGGVGFNVGGGIKLRLTEAFALRTEYRRYIFGDSDWGVNALIGAISWFF